MEKSKSFFDVVDYDENQAMYMEAMTRLLSELNAPGTEEKLLEPEGLKFIYQLLEMLMLGEARDVFFILHSLVIKLYLAFQHAGINPSYLYADDSDSDSPEPH